MARRDWVEWHRGYEDPQSSLPARLTLVRCRIGEVLDDMGARCTRILSLCAGDGRDLLPELAARQVGAETVLVELDPTLALLASQRAASLGLERVRVVQADAGSTGSFANAIPVDLLLLCGIFGNVGTADIRATLNAVPAMVSAGGYVIWTRGWFEDLDLRPTVRRWSEDAGLTEIAYDGAPDHFGVGVYKNPARSSDHQMPDRLFTFVQ